MNSKNKSSPETWAEQWIEDQLILRGWKTLRLKVPMYQGDLLAEKKGRTAKFGVKCRKLPTLQGQELQVFLGFHFHKKGSGGFLILHFNKPEWILTADAKKQFDEIFGSPNNYEQ